MENRGVLGGDGVDRNTGLLRRGVDLVIQIGDVARINHFRITPRENPVEKIENHRRPGVADMWKAVDRRSADVHRDPRGVAGYKHFLAACERIVELNAHGFWIRKRLIDELPKK